MTSQRSADRLNRIISDFLIKYGLANENPVWEIRKSSLGGFGVFVKRDVDVGEVIFIDNPVLIGPRCAPDCPVICVSCFINTKLTICERGCGLYLCSNKCEHSLFHKKECKILRENRQKDFAITDELSQKLFKNLTPIRSLYLDKFDKEVVLSLISHDRDKHGHEVDTLKNELGFHFKEDDEKFMRFVCCVLDANAFEVAVGNESKCSLRGLYPLGSLANHSCVPNTLHVFNEKQQMVTQAAVFIPKDFEIFHSYTRVIWGTTTRLYHLYKTKHFICKCDRCRDPTEYGTYMGSILCKTCRGIVSPLNPYKAFGKWQCKDCKNIITGKAAGETTALLGSILRNIETNDFEFMYKFLNGKLKTVVPEFNQVAVELKYKIIWVLGYQPGYKWEELTKEQISIKEQLCMDILGLLEQLRCGQNKIKGLLLYQLYCCKREKCKKEKHLNDKENNQLLTEAAAILKFDVAAPEEIKKLIEQGNLKT